MEINITINQLLTSTTKTKVDTAIHHKKTLENGVLPNRTRLHKWELFNLTSKKSFTALEKVRLNKNQI